MWSPDGIEGCRSAIFLLFVMFVRTFPNSWILKLHVYLHEQFTKNMRCHRYQVSSVNSLKQIKICGNQIYDQCCQVVWILNRPDEDTGEPVICDTSKFEPKVSCKAGCRVLWVCFAMYSIGRVLSWSVVYYRMSYNTGVVQYRFYCICKFQAQQYLVNSLV